MGLDSAVILCNGDPPGEQFLRRHWKEADLRIAADGGANLLFRLELQPDFIVGDLDSIEEEVRCGFPGGSVVCIEEQDTNDADKAIRFALGKGVATVHLLGAAGRRLDQFITNLEVMYKYADQLRIILWTELERMEFINCSWKDRLPPASTLSLLPVFGAVRKLTATGLAFPLQDKDLVPGIPPAGVSNKVVGSEVLIEIGEGKPLLVISSPDQQET